MGRLEFLSKFNKREGSNNSREDGKNFICAGEKTKGWKFSWIIINGEAEITAGRIENFLKINKQLYPSIWDLRVANCLRGVVASLFCLLKLNGTLRSNIICTLKIGQTLFTKFTPPPSTSFIFFTKFTYFFMFQTFILTFLELLWFPNPPVDKAFYQATYFGKIRSLLRPHQTSGSSTQNLHWKLEQQTTYAGTLLVDLETTYFLGIKLFCFSR